ncbi:MAG: DUF3857 domain-containing protein, partial [Deltaproteobacteria bacterium]|nr:DUF3857 domain-containing protein [Deltaproteobacteria bacterium]
VVGGQLQKGPNKLLVKVCQRTGPWQLRLRITDPDGKPLRLNTTTEIQATPDQRADKTPLPEVASLHKYLKNLKDDRLGFRDFMQAVWMQRRGFTRLVVEQSVELTKRQPECPLYQLQLARAHFAASHDGSAIKALRAAEKIQPGLVAIVLERVFYEQRNSRVERALKLLVDLSAEQQKLPSVQSAKISLLSDRGFNIDALRAAQLFLVSQPDRPQTWRQIASLHAALNQREKSRRAYQQALKLRANHTGTMNRLIAIALRRNQIGQALKLTRRKLEIFPCLITSALREAEIFMAQEGFSAALAVCERIKNIAPDYWYLYKLYGDILYRMGKRDQALDHYHTAIELHPDNPSLREYLDFLEHTKDPAFERYALSEDQIEQILAKKPELSAYPQAKAVFLLDDHVTHLFQDGSSKHLVHQIYFIRAEKGMREFNHFRVPASSSFRLEVAETIQPNGNRQEATSIRRGVIHFPSLEPGSILHVAYRYESSSLSWMQDHFAMNFNFQGPHPCLNARWVLVMPADKPLKILKRSEIIKTSTETLEGEKVLIWTAENAPMLHREALRPPIRLVRASVYVSTVPSWDELAKWQNSLISDQFDIDEDIRKKTREIVKDATTTMQKLRAVYQFVAKEIRYLNNDAGIFGKKPNKAVNIFENRFGDCKDKATLMIAMLKEIGIKAAYAGVRTFERGPVFWDVPHAQTNHIITYIPAQPGIEKELFVDGTSQFGDMLYLPDNDQGVKALVLDGEGHKIVSTPLLPADSTTLECNMRARIKGDSLNILADERWTGWFANWHRSRFNVEGKRTEELTKEINYRYPGAVLTDDTYSGLQTLSPEAGVKYKLKIAGRVRQESGTLRINLLWPSYMVRRTARKPERHYDVFMIYRTNIVASSQLTVPDDYKVRSLPKPIAIDNDLLSFKQECTMKLSTVTCKRSTLLKVRNVPNQRYQEYRDLCRQIDQAEAQDVVLEPI